MLGDMGVDLDEVATQRPSVDISMPRRSVSAMDDLAGSRATSPSAGRSSNGLHVTDRRSPSIVALPKPTSPTSSIAALITTVLVRSILGSSTP